MHVNQSQSPHAGHGMSVDRLSYARSRSGFTLIEILLAIALTSLVLAGLALVINDLNVDPISFQGDRFARQYDRMHALIRRDVCGLIETVSLQPEQSGEHGRAIASFRTTSCIDALHDGAWAGSAVVTYWVQETAERGKTLWRSETAFGQGAMHWTPVLDRLDSVKLAYWRDGQWYRWPVESVDGEDQSPTDVGESAFAVSAVRLLLIRAGDSHRRARQLPPLIFKSFHGDHQEALS